MTPRRHRSVSNVQIQSAQTETPPPQRTFTPATHSQRQLAMLPAVYQSNMKVLHRREPSITAILDQFSHVCLYYHNGEKWERHGYEGSMFLFEKSTQPAYGFYILNRMGTDDYVRPIYPEDDMEITGGYLMCRFYPDFTETRVDMGLPYPIPEEHREAFYNQLSNRIAPEQQGKDKDKEKRGSSVTLGLWMYPTDAREPLKEVMMRLHSYIRRGLPYPDEFRCGPGRPSPPDPHLRTASATSMHVPQEVIQLTAQANVVSASRSGAPAVATAVAARANAGSELDKLFSKLLPPSPLAAISTPPTGKSVDDLFASLNGGESRKQLLPAPPPAPIPASSYERKPSGIPLLDSIFASAIPTSSLFIGMPQVSPPDFPAQPEEIVIVSPKPTHSALPQVLNQAVISTLLGLGPDAGSRASSAAPSSVGSRQSAQRYEGDNEYSEGDFTSDGELSKSKTKTRAPVPTASRRVPGLPVPKTPSSESDMESGGKVNGSRRIPGDVTPRPPVGGVRLPPTSPPHFQQCPATPDGNAKPVANGTSAPSPAPAGSAPRSRPLVPFEANSDLWPYPRAPLDDRSFEQDDVVELDFADTRALSDPAIFSSRLKDKKDKKDRKSRREREREKERDKAEIEKGWDLPTQTKGQPAYHISATGPVAAAAAVPAQHVVSGSVEQAKKIVLNGTKGRVQNADLDSTSIKDMIIGSMLRKAQSTGHFAVSRNDFVQELLALIQAEPQFVDSLWQDYLSRAM